MYACGRLSIYLSICLYIYLSIGKLAFKIKLEGNKKEGIRPCGTELEPFRPLRLLPSLVSTVSREREREPTRFSDPSRQQRTIGGTEEAPTILRWPLLSLASISQEARTLPLPAARIRIWAWTWPWISPSHSITSTPPTSSTNLSWV